MCRRAVLRLVFADSADCGSRECRRFQGGVSLGLGREAVGAQDCEQGAFFVAFCAWGGGEYEEGLALVRVQEELAVEVQAADLGVDESFGFAPAEAHLVAFP